MRGVVEQGLRQGFRGLGSQVLEVLGELYHIAASLVQAREGRVVAVSGFLERRAYVLQRRDIPDHFLVKLASTACYLQCVAVLLVLHPEL